MCLNPATSREHAPPLCLFPEIKDIPTGENYRKNLITVPSCDEHNLKKSKDDQFLLLILLLHFESNEEGQKHFAGKLTRTLKRRSSLLGVLKDKEDVIVQESESSGFHINRDRFDATMDRIARAIHFAEYGEMWSEQIIINTPSLFDLKSPNSFQVNLEQQKLKLMIDKFLDPYPKKGENPMIFYYQIDKELQENKLLMKMVFYEGFAVYAYSSPEIAAWKRNSD